MKTTRFIKLGLASLLSVCSLLLLSVPNAAAAGTKTWSGTDCSGGSPNCNWSDTNNWVGGVIPGSGDDIVFDNSVISPSNSPTNDISSLDVNSISFINAGTGVNSIVLGSGLFGGDVTVDSAISQAASVTTRDLIIGTLNLGGNVLVTGSGNHLTLGSATPGQPNDILNLNSHTLTFGNVVNPGSTPTVAVTDIISGNGVVTYNGAATEFDVSGINTYTGTTNVVASTSWLGGLVNDENPFGSSSVIVGTNAAIKFAITANKTISNNISLAGGSATVNLPTAIDFVNASAGAVTLTMPNLTLLGNVRLSDDANMTINLSGVIANEHCVEYFSGGSLSSTPFVGGPAVCVAPASATTADPNAAAPKAPDTGLAAVAAHPILALSATVLMTTGLLFMARQFKAIKN